MYSREIAAQYDCKACEASTSEWDRLGRCTGPIPDGVVQLRVELDGVSSTAVYPEEFATCPMGLLRGDLRPDEVSVAGIVSHAAAAEVDKRWPDVPAKLYALIREWRDAEVGRMRAEHEARMEGMKGGHAG